MSAPAAVSLYRPAVTAVAIGGRAEVAAFGPVLGGFILNPATAEGQGLETVEVLYVDVVSEATVGETVTSVPIQPGARYTITPGQTTNVSVNAASDGHKFAGVIFQAPTPYPPTPQSGTFPPPGPTTLTELIPAYLYQQYADDEDLQAFFASYNDLAQSFVDWFADVSLPVYTGEQIAGALLDWVALGVYGMMRPTLSSGRNHDVGPLNTYPPNTLPPNVRRRVGPTDVTVTTDDVFKRIMTWNFYKGDGNVFNVRWLKRRVMRFLDGVNGTAPNIEQTYAISVTYGPGVIAIRINVGTREITGGALPNRFACNTMTPNALRTAFHPGGEQFALQRTFKEAMDSGALQVPFQESVSVLVS